MPGRGTGPNRLGPLGFVLVFGLVSGLGDVVDEGARSITGPFLATFGASAALVGVITGLGEAVTLVLRLVRGRLSDRTGRHWARVRNPRRPGGARHARAGLPASAGPRARCLRPHR